MRTHGRYLALTGLSALWLACPFLHYAWRNPSLFLDRSQELSILTEVNLTGDLSIIPKRFAWTFLSFLHHNAAIDYRFCNLGPQLDYFCGALMVFGLALALLHWRKRASWMAFGGLLFGLAANAMALQGVHSDPTYSYINGQRYFIVVPFLFFLAAWALDWFFSVFSGLSLPLRRVGGMVLAILIAVAVVWNVDTYYFGFRDLKRAGDTYWGSMGFDNLNVGEFVRSTRGRFHILLDNQYYAAPLLVMTHGLSPINNLGAGCDIPLRKKVNKDVLLVILPRNYANLQKEIHEVYPRAVWGSVQNPLRSNDALTIEISKEDIEARQKGLALNGELQ